jgi:uncharacterized membrane protein
MNVLDWILLVIRWAHALGAVAWVGGGIFYLMALRPAFRRVKPEPEVNRSIGEEFRGLVNTAIVVLVVTGAILTVSRLTLDTVTMPYVAVLIIKVTLALYMMAVVRFRRPRMAGQEERTDVSRWGRIKETLTGPTALLVVGVIIFGLADVLAALFEDSLTR